MLRVHNRRAYEGCRPHTRRTHDWDRQAGTPTSSIPRDDYLARKRENQRAYRARNPGKERENKQNNISYTDREQRRNAKRHAAEWLLHPSHAEPVIVDGEADEGGHYYLFQAYSYELGMRTLRVEPPARLGLFAVARFLWSIQREMRKKCKKSAVFLYFAMGYDIAQQLYGEECGGGLSHEEAQALWSMRSRSWGAVRGPDFRPEMFFAKHSASVQNGRKQGHVLFHGERLRVVGRVAWSDMFSLSNKSLVATIEDWSAYWTTEERAEYAGALETVKLGKAARGRWAEQGYSPEDIEREYQVPELRLMYWYAKRIIHLCADLGFAPRSLAGPAPMARALMTKYGVTAHIKPGNYDTVEWQDGAIMREWIRPAMFGGNIQLCEVGTFAELHSYDIASAYPHWIRQLPCMAHGNWVRLDASALDYANRGTLLPYAIYEITWQCPRGTRWPPLPVRDKHGGIRYPLSGTGRYCTPEVLAFLDCHGTTADYDITDGWAWVPACTTSDTPFAPMIEETYRIRAEYKADGRPESTILKLALNSCYGVMAQTSGSYRKVDENGTTTGYHTPKNGNLFAAAFITSGCRSDIMRLIARQPDAVIAVMTDAVLSIDPVAVERSTGELGSIEYKHLDITACIAPGVYASRDNKNKYRGVPGGSTWEAGGEPCASMFHAYEHAIADGDTSIDACFEAFQNPYAAGADPAHLGEFIPSRRTLDVSVFAVSSKRDALLATQTARGTVYLPPYPIASTHGITPYTRPMDRHPREASPETDEPMVR